MAGRGLNLNPGAFVAKAMPGIVRTAVRNPAYLIEADLAAQVAEAAAEASARTSRQVVAFGQLVTQGLAGIDSKLAKAHEELAKGAQQATIAAYEKKRDEGRGSPPYRLTARDDRNRRYAGGFLLAALSSGAFISSNAQEIGFANIPLLDAAAKQWARLNFGAGSAAGGSGTQMFDVRWSNLDVASIGVEERPRPGFRIPRGHWFGKEFYPLSEVPSGYRRSDASYQRERETKGIKAEHWLDAGIEYIAKNLGETYRNIYIQVYKEAAEGAVDVAGVPLANPGKGWRLSASVNR